MALVSPGTEVTIIDQSQYLPAASSSVPLIILATATNKLNAAGTAIATGTTAANANKLYQITSQRDLVTLFGNPFFYKTSGGTPIHGYELNEYGLLAAYSLLGITNRCYVLRADIDLGSLVGTLNRPKGDPADGTYWLDTTNSTWGIYEFNANTSKFTNKVPLVISSNDLVDQYNIPLASFGNIGDYCVDARDHITNNPINDGQYYLKTTSNNWVRLGSKEWSGAIPTALSVVPSQSLNNGKFYINFNNEFQVLVEINGNSISDAANAVNALGLGYLSANIVDGKMAIYASSPNPFTKLTFIAHPSSPNILDSNNLGLSASPAPYWQPVVAYGTSGEMPLWTSAQNTPRPTGSVWIKTSTTGGGINLVLSQFSKTTGSFVSKKVSVYHSLAEALYKLDATGGSNIPVGTLIADTIYEVDNPGSPMTIHRRRETGPTIVTGTVIDPSFTTTSQTNQFTVVTDVPNSPLGSNAFIVTLPIGLVGPNQFAQAWQAANIPYTTCTVTATKQIQITITTGGGFIAGPYITAARPFNNVYALDQVGFTPGVNPKATNGYVVSAIQTSAEQYDTTGSGSGAIFNITAYGNKYNINSIVGSGSGYQVGDQITIKGSRLFGSDGTHDLIVEVTSLVATTTNIENIAYVSGQPNMGYFYGLSNWERVSYTANEGAPFANPPKNTKWYYSSVSEADIMVNQNGVWKGYRNVAYDSNGHPIASAYNQPNLTDLNGPIIATDEPTTQSDGVTSLRYGDLWLDSNDLENYPALYRWQQVEGVNKWVSIDNTDQTSTDGILFADARWATDEFTDPVNDPKPLIKDLLQSNYLDLDAPLATLYPQGMLLWNTRRSGYNVKSFQPNYFNGQSYPDASLPSVTSTWISVSGLKADGSAYMGRKAQRNLIVQSLKASIGTNMSVREEDTYLNLIAAPGYPELQPDMVELSNERNNTAFVVGDTPMRLSDSATEISAWATNEMNAVATGEEGLVGRSEYMGIFYPSGITTDLSGAQAVVPASHMILRTILRNDTIAYPWLAPAGTRRGTIDNCTNIGYIDAATGEFQVVKNRNSIRDVLYTNQINPLAFFTGVGLLNYGNKSSKDTMSALDRINVARLVCYIRERLQVVARPFIFEPNDSRTRSQIQGVVQTLFVDLVAKRGLYDFLVVCDDSNNTADRIDRNELYIDIAIEPVKSIEFIYIPVRILNTGGIAKLK
jgi:hypothetical protein